MTSLVVFFSLERIINRLGEWREKGYREKTKSKKAQLNSHRNSVVKDGDRKPNDAEDGILQNKVEEKLVGALESVIHGELNRDAKKVKVIRSGHKPNSDMVVGERVCKHRYSSICVDDIDELMNVSTPEGPNPTEDSILTKGNNNDNQGHRNSLKKKLQEVKDRVPDQLESQKDIKDNLTMSEEVQNNCDKSPDTKHLDSINESMEKLELEFELDDSKLDDALEVNLKEKLLNKKNVIMNGSPTKMALFSEGLLGI